MNRQRFLIILLLVVAATLLPTYFIDRANARLREEMTALVEEMGLARDKAVRVRELEARLAEEERALAGLDQRLISDEPFADMERELRALTGQAGLRMTEMTLGGSEPLKELPSLLQYTATVELSGSVQQYVAFLRLLENHRLLIDIPDLKLSFGQSDGLFRTRLTLHFYGKAPGGS
ncbi:MAG: hypothetical protein ACOY93_22280 [Bacillota bacterium]